MAIFDVRTEKLDPITEIRCASPNANYYVADTLKPDGVHGFEICDSHSERGSNRKLSVRSVEHADNLIKAIEEAKKLGWVK